MTAAFAGSNPASPVLFYGVLAQSVEHLTFNQVVRGSNPRCLISGKHLLSVIFLPSDRVMATIEYADMAELADALVLGTSGLPVQVQVLLSALIKRSSVNLIYRRSFVFSE